MYWCINMAAEATEPKTFLKALHDKYGDNDIPEGNDLVLVMHVPNSAPGMTDSGQLILPRQLAMNYHSITHAGNEEEIANLCDKVTELDIANNCISDWKEIFKMMSVMPKIESINFSCNPLMAEIDDEVGNQSFPNIKRLILNKTGAAWSTVEVLLKIMPSVEELHLSLNDYTEVDLKEKYPNVVNLHFNANKLRDWGEICKLGRAFPNLCNLVMAESEMSLCDDLEIEESFPKVVSLNANKIGITSWEEIDRLNSFPALTDVRLQGVPLLEDMKEEQRRQFLIARLPRINRLNGSKIQEEERDKAERAFLRHFMDSEEKPERYMELEKTHGQLDPLADVNLGPPTHTVTVRVTYDTKVRMLSICLDNSIVDLKNLIRKLFEIPKECGIALYYNNAEGTIPYRAREMDPSKYVYTYLYEDGCDITVEPREREGRKWIEPTVHFAIKKSLTVTPRD
ncbi:tubulin-specific chaperone cofactor E-like protein isoform X1 [Lingula anatina]|uniref:Tubulin-specific chaperone cofactor E-like protein isoform X1 n=2 Tax=Lingula anatina TaxID=7574 RepID=A0A1S3JNG5_LINAN|nr:tubulin-specific chaperone cofactor E-like protein isoform X1 [Lingula anatina]|eukprot:XP_013411903.1 tubulin-specific chaperone cofactor E-like protein isoform X1 [Lingula anatina]